MATFKNGIELYKRTASRIRTFST